MKRIQYIIGASVLLFGFTAAAQTCEWSTDCSGSQICMDLICQDSAVPQNDCDDSATEGDDECDWNEICHNGVCKPEGVSCTTETGDAMVTANSTEVNCGGGMGSASSSDSSGNSDTETITASELYAQCLTLISDECGDEVPVPEEVCSAGDLVTCTDWVLRMQEIEGYCEDYFDGGDDDSAPTTVYVPYTETSANTEADETAPSFYLLFPSKMTGLAAEADVWMVTDCCEELAGGEAEDLAELTDFFGCIAELETSDCEGIDICSETYLGERFISGTSNDEADALEDADDGESIASGDDTNGDDGSCSIAKVGSPLASLFSLLF